MLFSTAGLRPMLRPSKHGLGSSAVQGLPVGVSLGLLHRMGREAPERAWATAAGLSLGALPPAGKPRMKAIIVSLRVNTGAPWRGHHSVSQ